MFENPKPFWISPIHKVFKLGNDGYNFWKRYLGQIWEDEHSITWIFLWILSSHSTSAFGLSFSSLLAFFIGYAEGFDSKFSVFVEELKTSCYIVSEVIATQWCTFIRKKLPIPRRSWSWVARLSALIQVPTFNQR